MRCLQRQANRAMLEAGTQVQTHAPVMMALGPEELAEAEK
ncbi:hypothetical protein SAMN05421881_101440 [Nitrosomonas halophila]|uniref:Uncharacterized protein n=1 Tax=Nitrosomonas halophila TaxID=44576 RepID=A0A1H3G7I0_9PROT|nr:hypothetical protein SAMN05421881_101440 [Nitrosomonas halophila]